MNLGGFGCIPFFSFVTLICSHAPPVLTTRGPKSPRQKVATPAIISLSRSGKVVAFNPSHFLRFRLACLRKWWGGQLPPRWAYFVISYDSRKEGKKVWRLEREFERGEHIAILFIFLCFFCWAAFGDHVTYDFTYPWIYSMLDEQPGRSVPRSHQVNAWIMVDFFSGHPLNLKWKCHLFWQKLLCTRWTPFLLLLSICKRAM